ncbi:DHA2 family efflux MFS transporter permease subunit (plasmid) [Rhodococcus sp. USK10]|uniref:DHA2 family efflux MFS transporter permease subunit n=1 Tax=Rhodococcus sp. USK10 TaxID=2789739 RepID=UPI001C5FB8F7|nr:DHA2 family efflux MFS transporter permease subunit [Rhodococcus sp. USK10]QYA99795.1 DHA2 family efflux MFS transporter permease subunit [Rhodococcus sp. USK10]
MTSRAASPLPDSGTTAETPRTPAGGTTISPASASNKKLARAEKLVLGILMASAFIVLTNEMLLGVAIPTLINDLELNASTAQWLTTGYLLVMAILIPTTGFIMRAFHLRTIYLTSMTLFILGTALGAAASGFGLLLAGRIVQAAGSAIFLPLLMSTTMRLVPVERRGRFMAMVVVVTAVGPALAPGISGLVLSQLGWRWLFLGMLPLALLGLALGAVKLKNSTTREPGKVDLLSILLSVIGFGTLVYGLATMGESITGHTSTPPLMPILVGVAGIAAFVFRQSALQRNGEPLLDLRIFRAGGFVIPLTAMLGLTLTGFGAGVIYPLVLSSIRGLEPLDIGLLLIPGGITVAIVSAIGGQVYDRVGPRPLVISGAITVAISFALMTRVTSDTPTTYIVSANIIMFVGQALMWTPLTTAALSALSPALYPYGSAAFGSTQQLGGGAGIAVLISAYTLGSNSGATSALTLQQSVSAAQAAFTAGLVIACLNILVTLSVRRPSSPRTRPRPRTSPDGFISHPSSRKDCS